MSLNLNKVILAGRLTADPELKQTQSGVSIATFTLAVNRKYVSKNSDDAQPQADFFRITAWRNTAEFVSKYFKKGSALCLLGSIQNRSWEDDQGQKHFVTDIVADEVNFVESKGSVQESQGQPKYNIYDAPSTPKFEEIKTDEDLPF